VPETTTPLRSVSVTARGGTIDPLAVAVAVGRVSDGVGALRVALCADRVSDAVAPPEVAPVPVALVAALRCDTDSVDGCVPPLRVPPPPVVRPVRVPVAVPSVADADAVAVPADAEGPDRDAVAPDSD
jgi:hypothetical protein